jgi:hypothetical protein
VGDNGDYGIRINLENRNVTNTITNCVVYNHTYYGIFLRTRQVGATFNVENVTVNNNTNCGIYVILVVYSADHDLYFNLKNSIITNNTGSAISVNRYRDDGRAHVSVTYCDIWQNGTNQYAGQPTNVGINPLFKSTDPGNLDFHLQDISPIKTLGENGSEMGAYGGLEYKYPHASVTMLTPAAVDTADTEYVITFQVANPDSPTITFNLYYDTDNNTLVKKQIATAVTETTYLWDTRNIPNGDYYLFVEVEDGPSYDYSDAELTILHAANVAPIIVNNDTTLAINPGAKDSITLQATDMNEDTISYSYANNVHTTVIQVESLFYIVGVTEGTDTVLLIASDGEAADTMQVVVTVEPMVGITSLERGNLEYHLPSGILYDLNGKAVTQRNGLPGGVYLKKIADGDKVRMIKVLVVE